MQKANQMKQIARGIYLIILVLLISTSLFPGIKANAAQTWISCSPVQLMTYKERVHVRCATAIGGIYYFAAPTSDPQYAERALGIISSALVMRKTLSILYDPADLSGASYGCDTSSCRPILAVGFGQ